MLFVASMGLKADPDVVAQVDIDGIIYSLTNDNKAMVMPAMAFEGATGIEEVNSQQPKANSRKLLRNGQLLIIRDGRTYNAQGVCVQ